MKRLLSLTLGVLTAIGGFLDIGELVTGSLTGARFGLGLAWVVVLGVIAIMLYAEMSLSTNRPATVHPRACARASQSSACRRTPSAWPSRSSLIRQ